MTNKFKQGKRLEGRFVSFPQTAYDSENYLGLKPTTQQIFFFMCTQYNGSNNGDLTCTPKAMREKYKMKITDRTVYRAIQELLDSGLLARTIQGGKHKPSRFALAIYAIDKGGDLEKETKTPPLYKFLRRQMKLVKIKSAASPVSPENANSCLGVTLKSQNGS